ncbi:lipid II:glycine glycyltransferase FemX [Planctomycetaceae bacterium SH139]
MSSANVDIKEYREIPQWDQFVLRHPSGSVLHTTSMIRCRAATPNHFPHAYGALDAGGELIAILVASRIVTMSGLGQQITARSIMAAEPLFLNTAAGRAGIEALLQQHDRYMRTRALFSEIRPIFALPERGDPLLDAGYSKLGYLNYEFELCPCEQQLFRRLGAKRRNNVRAAERKGVSVREVSGELGLSEMYSLVSASHARAMVPLADRALFASTALEFPRDVFRIYTAYHEGAAVASACFLAFKDRVICWYAGTLRIRGVPGTTSVFWHAMKSFAAEGYRVFDFAGGGWEGEPYGPGKFKAKFGGSLTNHGRYRKVYAPWKLRIASVIYDRVRGYISPKHDRSGLVC